VSHSAEQIATAHLLQGGGVERKQVIEKFSGKLVSGSSTGPQEGESAENTKNCLETGEESDATGEACKIVAWSTGLDGSNPFADDQWNREPKN
jgi:hypothetical protein